MALETISTRVASFEKSHDAYEAKDELERNGIPTALSFGGETTVFVLSADVLRARALLANGIRFLRRTNNDRGHAAKTLGIDASTLYRWPH